LKVQLLSGHWIHQPYVPSGACAIKLFTLVVIVIVSKSPSETTDCPQTFIVKTLIIKNTHSRHIYMKRKEGASVQISGETERESVCETAS
jgi:hypothetical protein